MLLTVKETAVRLGISEMTIRKWLAAGRVVDSVRLGRSVRIPEDEVQRLIRDNTRRGR